MKLHGEYDYDCIRKTRLDDYRKKERFLDLWSIFGAKGGGGVIHSKWLHILYIWQIGLLWPFNVNQNYLSTLYYLLIFLHSSARVSGGVGAII